MHFIVYCAKFTLLLKSVNIRLLSSIYCYSSNNFELTLAMHNQNIVSSSYHHRYNPDLVKLNYQIKSKYHCCNLYITTCCVIHMNTFALGFGQHFLLPIPLLTKQYNLSVSNMIELRYKRMKQMKTICVRLSNRMLQFVSLLWRCFIKLSCFKFKSTAHYNLSNDLANFFLFHNLRYKKVIQET